MGIVKKFIGELTKHNLLIYFAIFWGFSMFFWSLYDLIYYFSDLNILPIIYNLLELGAGLFLALFGIKLIKTNFLEMINTEKALLYFLVLWAAKFFFTGIYDIIDFAPWMFENLDYIPAVFGALADFFSGIVLLIFAWNLLNEKETNPIE